MSKVVPQETVQNNNYSQGQQQSAPQYSQPYQQDSNAQPYNMQPYPQAIIYQQPYAPQPAQAQFNYSGAQQQQQMQHTSMPQTFQAQYQENQGGYGTAGPTVVQQQVVYVYGNRQTNKKNAQNQPRANYLSKQKSKRYNKNVYANSQIDYGGGPAQLDGADVIILTAQTGQPAVSLCECWIDWFFKILCYLPRLICDLLTWIGNAIGCLEPCGNFCEHYICACANATSQCLQGCCDNAGNVCTAVGNTCSNCCQAIRNWFNPGDILQTGQQAAVNVGQQALDGGRQVAEAGLQVGQQAVDVAQNLGTEALAQAPNVGQQIVGLAQDAVGGVQKTIGCFQQCCVSFYQNFAECFSAIGQFLAPLADNCCNNIADFLRLVCEGASCLFSDLLVPLCGVIGELLGACCSLLGAIII